MMVYNVMSFKLKVLDKIFVLNLNSLDQWLLNNLSDMKICVEENESFVYATDNNLTIWAAFITFLLIYSVFHG